MEQSASDIADHISRDVIVEQKSTVPVGTNYRIRELIRSRAHTNLNMEIVTNLDFLKERSTNFDVFHGDWIIIGADNEVDALINFKLPSKKYKNHYDIRR